ncbi:MAG: M50 family metallopeptidase [Myxococcota bacterium]
MSIVLSILALSVLIVVHEGGHMVVARWCGMRVERFSIFFGPVLARFKRGETTYQIAAIPLGGFVQIAGMNPAEQLSPDDSGSFENKPVLSRLATIFAGPATNYLFATVLAFAALVAWGMPTLDKVSTRIEAFAQASTPAKDAGLLPGDRIARIEGREIRGFEDVRRVVMASGGRPLAFEVERHGKPVRAAVRPRPRAAGGYEIGVAFEQVVKWEPVSYGHAAVAALVLPGERAADTLAQLWGIVSGKIKPEVGGPVAIVGQLKVGFDRGLRDAVQMLIMLNILLCVFNLLPIPALDGGRLAFLAYSAVTRRRVNPRVEMAVHTVGFVLLFGLLLLVTFKDIQRLVQ